MILKNLINGFFLGLGFMAAMVITMVGIEASGWKPGKNRGSAVEEANKEDDFSVEKITSKVESVRFFKQRVIASVSVFNDNSKVALDTTLYTTIYYEGQPIDECVEMYLDIESKESKSVNVYCRWNWKDMDAGKLSAQTRVELSRY